MPELAFLDGIDPAAELRQRFDRLMARTRPDAVKAYAVVEYRSDGWAGAGVEVQAGDRATAMVAFPGMPARPPSARLHMRVGTDGTPVDARGRTHSIVASRTGAIEVALDAPSGNALAGSAVILTIVWQESALRGLRYVAGAGDIDGLVREEIHRLCDPADAQAAAQRRRMAAGLATCAPRMLYRW